MTTTDRPPVISGQWCLVTVRQKRRESFLSYLDIDIKRKQLQELILEVVKPEDSVYENMVLIRIGNFAESKIHLQKIDHFQSIQRLNDKDVRRMLNR